MADSSKITISVEELVNLTAHAATQQQLDETRRELDSKIEKSKDELKADIQDVRTELKAEIQSVRNCVDSLQNMLIVISLSAAIATILFAGFYIGEKIG